MENLDAELKHLALEHSELKRLAQEQKLPAGRFDLADGEQRLDELRKRRERLRESIERIEQAIKEAAQNVVLNQQVEQARLLEAQADFGPAIAIYEKVLATRPGETKVQEHLDELERGWALKGDKDKHKAARAFVYDTWAGNLDVAGLKKNLDEAKQALATLKTAGDRLTMEKMRQANTAHAAYLKKERDRLRRTATIDNLNREKGVGKVAAGLAQLHGELTAFVAAHKE